MPILHSKDLVNWEIINYAIGNLYEGDSKLLEHFKTPQHGNGVWAPSIRYHAGQYYIYWGDPDFGVYVVKTVNSDPAGEWTKPECIIKGAGYIDTTPLWDEDGRCYLVKPEVSAALPGAASAPAREGLRRPPQPCRRGYPSSARSPKRVLLRCPRASDFS